MSLAHRLWQAAVLLALLAPAGTARAQMWRQDAGVYFPGQALADPRGALSLRTNPAGLTDLRGFEGRLQLSGGGSWVGGSRGAGWGAFAAAPVSRVTFAAAVENVRDTLPGGVTPGVLDLNRLSAGAGLRLGDRLSLGAAARTYGVPGPDAGWASSWDFALLTRPWSWLSFAWRVTGLAGDASELTVNTLRTRYAWGLALRPFAGSDRLTASLDLDWPEDDHLGTVTLSLRSRIMDGLAVMLETRNFRHNRTSGGPDKRDTSTSLLFELGFGRWGTDVSFRGDTSGLTGSEGGGLQLGMRISGDVPHSFWSPGPASVIVPLSGTMSETPGGRSPHFGQVVLDLRAIAADPAIELVALRAQGLQLNWAQVEELRSAIAAMRKAGKHVVFYADSLGNRGLAVAAACDKIAMPPSGSMTARGVGVHFVGLQQTLDKVGIAFEVVRHGAHKSAPESLNRKHISPQLKTTMTRLANARWRGFVQAVALGRGVTVTRIESAIDRGVAFPADAKKAGLIDFVGEPKQLEKQLAEWRFMAADTKLRPYARKRKRRKRWGQQPRLAVLAIEGTIVDGSSGNATTGRSSGGAEVARKVDHLRRDGAVRGLVARIDSGGGAVRGSDLMYDALKRFGKKKPVVTSMGGVAASGGYWAALGGQTMYADASTVTGSIGIFGIKPNMVGLWQRIGLGVDGVGVGPHWDLMTAHRPWTPGERELVHRVMGRYYGLFLDRAGERRKMQRPQLLSLAEGRIWLGDEAKAHGLIDKVGGLWQALDDLRFKAGLADEEEVAVDFWPQPGLRTRLMRLVGLASAAPAIAEDPVVQALLRAAGPLLDRAAIVGLLGDNEAVAVTPLRFATPAP